jgi:hypothetical protein
MTGLMIFTELALAGCVFLLYFLYALWRDARESRRGPRLEMRRLPSRVKPKAKLLRLYPEEQMRERKRL